MSYFAIGATIVSGFVQYDASRTAGKKSARNAAIQAGQTEAEARQADREAREQINRMRTRHKEERGRITAAYAGSGVVSSTGSPLNTLGEAAARQELETQDAARKASTEYTRRFGEARQLRVGGKAALSGANARAAGSLLNAGASALGTYNSSRSLIPKTP
jgi:hypothetical protein